LWIRGIDVGVHIDCSFGSGNVTINVDVNIDVDVQCAMGAKKIFPTPVVLG
jgi:hypothetical protein